MKIRDKKDDIDFVTYKGVEASYVAQTTDLSKLDIHMLINVHSSILLLSTVSALVTGVMGKLTTSILHKTEFINEIKEDEEKENCK